MTIGVSNLPDLKKDFLTKRGLGFNIMVIGSNSLGKTTMINNLIGKPILKTQPFNESVHDKFWYNQHVCNIQISKITLTESEFSLKLTVIEVDGIGDQINNFGCEVPVLEELKSRFLDFQEKLQQNVKNLIDDQRVHLCLYMLEPLESIDVANFKTLEAISSYCPVIPVIAKLDLLNLGQIENIRNLFKKIIKDNQISFYKDRAVGIEYPIFVSLGITQGDSISYVRSYPWGDLNVLELSDNGLSKLKDLIFGKSLLKMIKATDFLYENFKVSQLAEKFVKNKPNKSIKHQNTGIYNKEFKNAAVELQNRISESSKDSSMY